MCWFPSRRDLLSSYWKQRQQSGGQISDDGKSKCRSALTSARQQRRGKFRNAAFLQTFHVLNPLDVWTHWMDPPDRRRSLLRGGWLTYADDDRRHESPAHLEEEGRREAQHHLHVPEVVPVTCQATITRQVLNIGHVQAVKARFFYCRAVKLILAHCPHRGKSIPKWLDR